MASGIQDSAHASLPDPDSKCSGSSKWVFHWKAPTPQQLRILMEENLHCPEPGGMGGAAKCSKQLQGRSGASQLSLGRG